MRRQGVALIKNPAGPVLHYACTVPFSEFAAQIFDLPEGLSGNNEQQYTKTLNYLFDTKKEIGV